MLNTKLIPPPRQARQVRVRYRNPAVRTRSGKLASGSVTFEADGVHFEVHTVYGAASILGRSVPRVQQLLESGKLPGYRVGRDWIVLDIDLRRFIKNQGANVRRRFAAFLAHERRSKRANPAKRAGKR